MISMPENAKYDIPELYALVLAGGKSKRMGQDKSHIIYHTDAQQIHTAHILKSLGLKTFISKKNADDKLEQFEQIVDTINMKGPMAGIYSAFAKFPHRAFIVLACDLPLITTKTISLLIAQRDPKKMATCIKSPEQDFPEPLISIYEPAIFDEIKQYIEKDILCPRKLLINSDCKIVELNDALPLMNANTPEERAYIEKLLSNNDNQSL